MRRSLELAILAVVLLFVLYMLWPKAPNWAPALLVLVLLIGFLVTRFVFK